MSSTAILDPPGEGAPLINSDPFAGNGAAVISITAAPPPAAVAPPHRLYDGAKRVVDLTASAIGILMCLPLLLLIAIAIKLSSRGPVFFRQRRPGRGGRQFRILKFRTMYLDAHRRFKKLSPEQQREFNEYGKISTDPRVTPVGRWLRRFSVDELPQLINVLRGEMSLVGPRPYLNMQLKQMGAHRRTIFEVAPGLTGIWQVSGRNEISSEQRLEMDVEYVLSRSIRNDLAILARTPLAMISGTGAY
ncbi:MAG: UDP-phosphate galactose phosphotransferase [Phycisphaeraceae bacterium]|nr:UDP-phosphate galactose phosphotransferase [Phycisphaeraceae bacterium]